MGFFGALYTGTAGLLAQERSTGFISENIANVTTVGYKRMDAAFHELVSTNKSTNSRHGGVGTERINHIDLQGGIRQSGNETDIAITGAGFFAVREDPSDPNGEFLYTRNGSFQQDLDGILRNSAGFALYGWPITNGVVGSGATTASLQPLDVNVLQTTSIPTTQVSVQMNLDANETPINPHKLTPSQQLPVSNQNPHFIRGVSVFDTNGTERRVNFEFRAVTGPMAHFSSNITGTLGTLSLSDVMAGAPLGPTPFIADGDILQITDGTNTLDVTFRAGAANPALNEANTVEDMINVINNFAVGTPAVSLFTAQIDNTGNLLVQANDPNVTLDTSGSSAAVLAFGGLNLIQDPDAIPDYTYEPDALLGTNGVANPNQSAFPALANTTTPNPHHWWEMRVTTADPAAPSGSAQVEISKGFLNFTGSGLLNATLNSSGQALLDLGTINFDSADATEETSIVVDMAGFSQFGGNYDVLSQDQNGTGLGTFQGVQVTQSGIIQSVFTNGQRLDTYKIPLAHFNNPNGLERISGTAFAVTENSGDASIFDSGLGGTGSITVSALETSNVDIADEFSSLIVAQRSFSMNSRVITTVDEMTENLVRLKR